MEIATLQVAGLTPTMIGVKLPFSKQTSVDQVIDEYGANMMTELNEYNGSIDEFFHHNVSPKALNLLSNLQLSGDDHGKANRGIIAYFIIKAPIYWWCECETYIAGHTRISSQSTMHWDAKGLTGDELQKVKSEIPMGRELIKVDAFSYQTLRRIVQQRSNHRLKEWHQFIDHLKTLPFAKELIFRTNSTVDSFKGVGEYMNKVQGNAES